MGEAQRRAIKGLGKEISEAYKKHGHTSPEGKMLNMSPSAQDDRFVSQFPKMSQKESADIADYDAWRAGGSKVSVEIRDITPHSSLPTASYWTKKKIADRGGQQ